MRSPFWARWNSDGDHKRDRSIKNLARVERFGYKVELKQTPLEESPKSVMTQRSVTHHKELECLTCQWTKEYKG
jgi:hypothetical protein